MELLAVLADWPEWLVWCAASVGGVIAVAVVVCVIESALDFDNT